jgi:histone demethylase JARID1
MSFERFDECEIAYDDKRMCLQCQSVCVFSAIACECSPSVVSCLHHFDSMCTCKSTRRYLIAWRTQEQLEQLIEEIDAAQRLKRKPAQQRTHQLCKRSCL